MPFAYLAYAGKYKDAIQSLLELRMSVSDTFTLTVSVNAARYETSNDWTPTHTTQKAHDGLCGLFKINAGRLAAAALRSWKLMFGSIRYAIRGKPRNVYYSRLTEDGGEQPLRRDSSWYSIEAREDDGTDGKGGEVRCLSERTQTIGGLLVKEAEPLAIEHGRNEVGFFDEPLCCAIPSTEQFLLWETYAVVSLELKNVAHATSTESAAFFWSAE